MNGIMGRNEKWSWRNTPQAHIENKHDEICNNLVEKMSVSFEDTGIVFLNIYCKMHFNHFEPFAVKMENIKRERDRYKQMARNRKTGK